MSSKPLKIGFIGLGIVDAPLAGHPLFVDTRGKVPAEIANSIATQCLDAQGVAQRLKAGKTVVPAATIGRLGVRWRRRCQERGAIDHGGRQAPGFRARQAGVRADGQERWARTMGKNITLVGGSGSGSSSGQTCKVADQIVVALTFNAVTEGLLFAAKASADPAELRQARMGGLAIPRILDILGDRMVKRSFDPGFRIALHQKDLNLALGAARSLGPALPATSTAQPLFSACIARAGAARHHPGTVRVFLTLSNLEIGQVAG